MRPRQSLKRLGLMLGCIAITMLAVAQDPFGQQGDFLPPDQAFKPTLVQDGDELEIDWQIEPGYYLYRHSFMWFGPDGQEQRGARIIGEVDAEAFLDRYAQARQRATESTEG